MFGPSRHQFAFAILIFLLIGPLGADERHLLDDFAPAPSAETHLLTAAGKSSEGVAAEPLPTLASPPAPLAFWDRARGLLGVMFLLGLCWALSQDRSRIRWKMTAGGVLFQAAIGFLILKTDFRVLMLQVSGGFVKLLSYSDEGARFLFGSLLDASVYGVAFKVLPTIIFVSALTSVLYYLGVLQRVVFGFAWVMTRVMKLSGAESLATAANVFMGQTEAPLVVRPYIEKMTRSELMALMTGGMATIAGSVFGIYILILGGADEAAKVQVGLQLLTASFMNAPAALVVAKILVPERELIDEEVRVPREKQGVNLLDALATGTTEGLKLALNVAAMLIAFIAAIALINGALGAFGSFVGINSWIAWASGGTFAGLSLQAIAGFLFAPVAWLIGVPPTDILQVGQLLGSKMAANEFVAFQDLAGMQSSLSPRTVFISTFALCGFANFSSIGIQIGGIGALAPERRSDLARLGFTAMIGGTIASLLTASLAGIFF